jgi:hypothetical protein
MSLRHWRSKPDVGYWVSDYATSTWRRPGRWKMQSRRVMQDGCFREYSQIVMWPLCDRSSARPRWLGSLLDYLDDTFEQEWSFTELAAEMGVHTRHQAIADLLLRFPPNSSPRHSR